MIDYDGLRRAVVTGLEKYVGCPVERSNQNEPMTDDEEITSKYPYISYTITRPMSDSKGTYGEYDDGKDRNQFTQTWSITVLSDNDTESVMLAVKAREWFDHVGRTYLGDNNVVVGSVGGITNRDNVITIGYEYRKGFDVVFNLEDVIENPIEESGYIETVEFQNGDRVTQGKSADELNEWLENILSGR